MAITTTFTEIEKRFNPRFWKSIDDFEEYYLRRLQETLADRNYYTDRNGIQKEINPVNHFPVLKEYEVWVEGFSATGQSAEATLMGKVFARNFAQACDIVMCKNRLEWVEKENNINYKEYCPPRTWDYNPRDLSYWNCGLYWSEELARKTFG